MVKLIIIKKEGLIQEKKPKKFNEEDIYKYAGFKTTKDFCKVHEYFINQFYYKVFAKVNGKANNENKYELPPPIDNKLYFGNLCIVKYNSDKEVCELTENEWNKTYEDLFGGFEDIENSGDESERSMDTEIYSDEEYTSDGYLKDGFVVDDNDELQTEEYLSYGSE